MTLALLLIKLVENSGENRALIKINLKKRLTIFIKNNTVTTIN